MTRSKSNRLKRNKTKRYRQTKNKRRRQTKNKRRRQHGGEVKKYLYTPQRKYILESTKELVYEDVLKPGLIPGYSEIMDMMLEYERYNENEFIEKIKQRDVEMLSDCSSGNTIAESKIIVLRKENKTLLLIKLGNNSIKCFPDQYNAFASHNFRIFKSNFDF